MAGLPVDLPPTALQYSQMDHLHSLCFQLDDCWAADHLWRRDVERFDWSRSAVDG